MASSKHLKEIIRFQQINFELPKVPACLHEERGLAIRFLSDDVNI